METYSSLLPPSLLRRLFRLAVFIELLVLLVIFVVFQRPLAYASHQLAKRGLPRRAVVGILALAFLALFALGATVGVGRLVHEARSLGADLPGWLEDLRQTALYQT